MIVEVSLDEVELQYRSLPTPAYTCRYLPRVVLAQVLLVVVLLSELHAAYRLANATWKVRVALLYVHSTYIRPDAL